MAGEGEISAASLKEEGNAKFKAAQYAEAVEAYTRSLELDPSQHLCFSNRSAAHLKLQAAESSLQDAEQCIKLMPSWPKGYSRQAAALQELKRWDEAAAACEAGLAASGGDDALKKMLAEVKNRHLQERLAGLWSGAVSEVLGGYEQEMEFMDASSVRVGVLGRSVIGRYWMDCSQEPHHLNIQVPMQEMPGMPPPPPPPPVPYICKIDEKGLHLCCPFMTMDRPSTFEGPGYCLMVRGGLATSQDDDEVAKLSTEEKYMQCARELVKTLPQSLLQEVQQTDSEEVTREKLMAQVKFESCMFAVQKRFGEDVMREVLSSTRPDCPVAGPLKGTKELEQLRDKLRACGICPEEGTAPPVVAVPSSSPKTETKKVDDPASQREPEKAPSQPAPKETAPEEPAPAGGASCGPTVLVPVVIAAAVAAAVMMYVRRSR